MDIMKKEKSRGRMRMRTDERRLLGRETRKTLMMTMQKVYFLAVSQRENIRVV